MGSRCREDRGVVDVEEMDQYRVAKTHRMP